MTTTAHPLAEDLDHVLDHTRELWDDLRGERIFITGGTGFFGCWLLESFLWAASRLKLGVEAVVLTRDPDAFRAKAPHLAAHPSVGLLRGDVRSFAFPPGTFSYVIHAASESSEKVDRSRPLDMLDILVHGTHHALEFAHQASAGRLLFTSSGAVYGQHSGKGRPFKEGDPILWPPVGQTSLSTVYREGKLIGELLCDLHTIASGFKATVARCFAFVGPYLPLDSHFAIGNFIGDGLRGGPIRVRGDGSPFRSYLYGSDLAIWLWTILLRGEAGRIYNVGSETEVSIAELAAMVASMIIPVPEVQVAVSADHRRPPERYVPSTKRARTELGLEEWVNLDLGLRKTMRWHSIRGCAETND